MISPAENNRPPDPPGGFSFGVIHIPRQQVKKTPGQSFCINHFLLPLPSQKIGVLPYDLYRGTSSLKNDHLRSEVRGELIS
jgi:hypothetical protein